MKTKKFRASHISLIAVIIISGILIKINLDLPDISKVKEYITIPVKKNHVVAGERVLSPKSIYFIRSSMLPGHVTGAIITCEDGNFYLHKGIDYRETFNAVKQDISMGKAYRGGSTITQQVVRNAFFKKQKSFYRKMLEAVTALKIEKELTKEEILDYYLNLIKMADGVYGIKEGAYYYFGKIPQDLTAEEAAILAVLIASPEKRGKILLAGDPDGFIRDRAKLVIDRMKLYGYIK